MKFISDTVIRGKVSELLPLITVGTPVRTNANRHSVDKGNVAGEIVCVHEQYFTVGRLSLEANWCCPVLENGRPDLYRKHGCSSCIIKVDKEHVVRPYNATRVHNDNKKAWIELDVSGHLDALKKLT